MTVFRSKNKGSRLSFVSSFSRVMIILSEKKEPIITNWVGLLVNKDV